MKLIDTAEQCRAFAGRWREQYAPERGWTDDRTYGAKGAKRSVGVDRAAVDALPPEPTREQVEAICSRWSKPPACDECGADDGRAVVQLGDEPDYESSTAWICGACLRLAVRLLDA